MTMNIVLLFLCSIFTLRTPPASLTHFTIQPGQQFTTCQFLVRSPFENAVGMTHDAQGFVRLDPNGRADSAAVGLIEVNAASFTTGSGWRDKIMKSKYLETDIYPIIRFQILSIKPHSALNEDVRTPATVSGLYSLHGQTQEVIPAVFLTYNKSDSVESLRIEAEFEALLSDFDISVPKILFFKGGDYQKVTVDITAFALPPSTRE